MNRTLLAALLVLSILHARTPAARGDEFTIAGWNCENLFDTEDDPQVQGDEEFTPDAKRHWTKERLDIKLNNLAKIIKKMHDGKGPDVLGVCEIENRKVVEMLVEKLASLGRKYEIIHKDSPSERGIDCAIIYDSGVFSLVDSQFHHVDAENTRDIVEAKLHRGDNDLFVFMDHWPSRRHEETFRDKAADVARKRIDEILAADPKADIIMLGDFNDDATNESIRDHLRTATTSENLPAGSMFDTSDYIRQSGKGTFVYENKWDLLDHIIISPGLLDSGGFHWKADSTKRIDDPDLMYQPKARDALARPNASYTGEKFYNKGTSDHLPLNCVIVQ